MSEQHDSSETEASQAATATGQTSETQETTTNESTLSNAELQAQLDAANKRLSEVNHESADRRKKLAAYEKAEQERKESELSAAELLTQRDKELADLQASYEEAGKREETYNSVLEAQYEATVKDLSVPDFVQEAIKDRSVAERLKYINAHREQFSSGRGVDLSGGKTGTTTKVVKMDDLKGLTQEQINEAWPNLK